MLSDKNFWDFGKFLDLFLFVYFLYLIIFKYCELMFRINIMANYYKKYTLVFLHTQHKYRHMKIENLETLITSQHCSRKYVYHHQNYILKFFLKKILKILFKVLALNIPLRNFEVIYIYIYIYMCVCVCVCDSGKSLFLGIIITIFFTVHLHLKTMSSIYYHSPTYYISLVFPMSWQPLRW